MRRKTVFQVGDKIKDRDGKIIGEIVKIKSCENPMINKIDFGGTSCEKNNGIPKIDTRMITNQKNAKLPK